MLKSLWLKVGINYACTNLGMKLISIRARLSQFFLVGQKTRQEWSGMTSRTNGTKWSGSRWARDLSWTYNDIKESRETSEYLVYILTLLEQRRALGWTRFVLSKSAFFWDYSVDSYSGIRITEHTEYQFPKEQTLCYSENRIADITKIKVTRPS